MRQNCRTTKFHEPAINKISSFIYGVDHLRTIFNILKEPYFISVKANLMVLPLELTTKVYFFP